MPAMKITAEARQGTGKSVTRKLRAGGRIPAVLYGRGHESQVLQLQAEEFERLLARGKATSHVIQLEMGQGKDATTTNVLIKEIQRHPYRRGIVHVDLLEVSMTEAVSVKVPIVVRGESDGVKMGGILELKRREIEVTCLPDRIPDAIAVDITGLNIGDSIHVDDLTAPEGVIIPHDVNFTILSVVGAAAEPTPAEAEAEAAAEPAEPELIRKPKEEAEE